MAWVLTMFCGIIYYPKLSMFQLLEWFLFFHKINLTLIAFKSSSKKY